MLVSAKKKKKKISKKVEDYLEPALTKGKQIHRQDEEITGEHIAWKTFYQSKLVRGLLYFHIAERVFYHIVTNTPSPFSPVLSTEPAGSLSLHNPFPYCFAAARKRNNHSAVRRK